MSLSDKMTPTPTISSTLLRYQAEILVELRGTLLQISNEEKSPEASYLQSYFGQMHYHLGWVDSNFSPVSSNPGKLMRPTLLLLAFEAAGAWGLNTEAQKNRAYLRRALPAAAALELTHNFTLIHDDIEDGDSERRHRATLWKLWGIPQAINTGDGMYALARLVLWNVIHEGVEAAIAVHLGELLDRTCLIISEGQHLDISFESSQYISVAMYIDMISRKTASLMRCATEMGARLGTRDQETIERLRTFGYAIGLAFQVRDDLLGIWASAAELGKTSAGDIYRRKKSLPVLHALENVSSEDKQFLHQFYQQKTPVTGELVEEVLAILERTQTRSYCRSFLAHQCQLAHEALASVPRINSPVATRALQDMETLVRFVESAGTD